MTTYIIDTETTTNDRERAEVIELATAQLHPDLSAISPPEAMRFIPSGQVDFGALATHHILPEDLHDCHLHSADAALPTDTSYIIGHNVDFDWTVLGSPPVRRICTLAMARRVWPKLDSHKLGALVYSIMGASSNTRAYLREAHSAGADVHYCFTVLGEILRLNPGIKTVDALWQFSEESRFPRVMTFGKYKGEPIEAVDRGWIQWYRKQSDTDPYLLEAFRRLGR